MMTAAVDHARILHVSPQARGEVGLRSKGEGHGTARTAHTVLTETPPHPAPRSFAGHGPSALRASGEWERAVRAAHPESSS